MNFENPLSLPSFTQTEFFHSNSLYSNNTLFSSYSLNFQVRREKDLNLVEENPRKKAIFKKMMEHRRSSVSLEQCSLTDFTSKRHKADLSPSSKQKKEKVSERISALQQLVSPFGKTDTASVLLEAMEYIGFLHEQVKVLSAPYLYSMPTDKNAMDIEPYSLRSKGLCLVPISFTVGVASSNGADIWAPIKTRRLDSDEASVITYC